MRRGASLREYLRQEAMPNVWCPGCGHGNVMSALTEAFDRAQLDLDNTVVVGGIGCASRMPFFLDTNTMHTTHGRALAFATGIKLARPELTVIVIMGDGDALAIGGNHLIHACRRNIDLTALILNNEIYGMTGGQAAPTTPEGFRSTTSLHGSIESQFDAAQLALFLLLPHPQMPDMGLSRAEAAERTVSIRRLGQDKQQVMPLDAALKALADEAVAPDVRRQQSAA